MNIVRHPAPRILIAVSGIALAGLLALPAGSRGGGSPAAATQPSAELSGLQQQRIETLRQGSGLARQLFARGLVNADEVSHFDRALLEAELDAAASPDERVTVLRRALDAAKGQEDLAVKRAQAGLDTTLAPLQARADRLRVEIQLAEALRS